MVSSPGVLRWQFEYYLKEFNSVGYLHWSAAGIIQPDSSLLY